MNIPTREVSGLYPWTKDLEGSIDVRAREKAAFAMLLGWSRKGLRPTRSARKGLRPTRSARKGLRPTRSEQEGGGE